MQTVASVSKALGAFLILAAAIQAQAAEVSVFGAQAQVAYRVVPNMTYLTANNTDLKLDMYQARGIIARPAPANAAGPYCSRRR